MQWLRSVEMVMLSFLVLVMVLAVQWLRLLRMLMAMKIVTVKMLVMITPSFSMPDICLSSGHLVYLYNHVNIALQGAQTIP